MNRLHATLVSLLTAASSAAWGAEFDWIVGCWETPDGSAREVWVRQAPGQWVGMAAVASEGRVVFHEVLVIDVDEGVAHYTAHIGGQTTRFTADTFSDSEVAFLNPSHDFPQKVRYRRDGDQLLAAISLLDGSRAQTFDKQRCE